MNGVVAFVLKAVLGIDTSEYEKGLDDAKGKASSAGSVIGNGLKTIGKVGAVALGAATTAVEAFAASSVKTGGVFDKSMSQVAATMGFTTEQLNATEEQLASMSEGERNAAIAAQESFGQLRNYAQEMGRTTAFSASQASEALNYMALAGYDTETSMKMLPNVLNLAAAGNMELATASDMVTDAQSALGLNLEETAAMVDQMAKSSSKSNTSVSQLGEAMLTIGATARGVKGGTVELSTVLGVLADNGIKGAEGGTHLRNAILSLQTPTKDGIAALAELGMTYDDMYDSSGNLRSLPEIFQQMSTAMEGMTQQSKDAIISGVFNKTDLAAVNALIGTNAERWDELTVAIGDSKGAAEAMAQTQLDNLAGDVTLFKSALEGAQITVSDQLTPSLRDFVQFGTDGLSRLTDAFQEGGITGAMVEFGTVLSEGIAMVTEMLPEAMNAGMQLLGALGQGILNNMPVVIDATVQIVNQIVTGITNALPKVAQGATQIIIGLTNGLANMAPTLIPTIVQVVIDIVKTLIDNAPMMITAAVNLIQGLADGLIASIPVIINALPTIITSIITAFTSSIPRLIQGTIQLVMGIVDALPTIIQSLIDALPQIIEAVIQGLITCLPALIQGHIMLILALVQALPQIMQALYDALPTIIQTVVSTLIANLPLLIDGFIQLIAGIAQALPQIAMAIINVIPNIVMMAVNAIQSVSGEILNAIVLIFTSIVNLFIQYGAQFLSQLVTTLTDIWNKAVAFGKQVADFLIKTFKDFLDKTNNGMRSMFNKIVEWLSQIPGKMAYYAGYAVGSFMKFLLELPGKVTEVFNNVITNLVAFAEDFVTKAEKAAKDFLDKIVNGIKDLPTKVEETLNNIITKVTTFASDFLRKAQDAAKDFLNGIKDGIANLPTDVETKLGEVITKAATFVTDLGTKASDAASGFVTNLINGVSSLPGDFESIGSNIVNGIWNGISGGWDWLREQVSNLAASLFRGAKDALGIKSPSKKFAWIGQMVDEGFAKGLNDYSYLVDGALDDIINMPSADDMVGNVSLNASGKAGNNGYTQILNITSPTALSPYEVARQARNATRDMVLAMSV